MHRPGESPGEPPACPRGEALSDLRLPETVGPKGKGVQVRPVANPVRGLFTSSGGPAHGLGLGRLADTWPARHTTVGPPRL